MDKLAQRYEIVRPLGSGGFSETWLAKDTHLPGCPLCVVKKLVMPSGERFLQETARRLFDTEARVLARLGQHPQIPQLLAHFEENGHFYLVQEYIEGHDLTAELTRPMGEAYTVALLREILPILDYIHQEKAIHRDLKPANLIRRRDGTLFVIDFGAVKQIDPKARSTVAIGTPGFMPQEQVGGRPQPNSDLYALGAIAVQALTGLPPHLLPTDPVTGSLCWRDRVTVNPELAAILERLLHPNWQQRFHSAREVMQTLAGKTPLPARAARPWLPVLGGLGAIGTVLGLYASRPLWQKPLSSDRPPPAFSETTDPDLPICRVTTAVVNDPDPPLNVRAGPSVTEPIVGTLPNGTLLFVSDRQEGWLQITAPLNGWVAGNRVEQNCNEKEKHLTLGATPFPLRDRFVGPGVHRYRFAIAAPQVLHLVNQGSDLEILIYDPTGAMLGQPQQLSPKGQRAIALPTPGTYILELNSHFRGYPYDFTARLQPVSP
ncbi:MAG: serine/threonine protein kinase [Pseudanabaenaceae cyanobacterium]